MHMYFLRVCLLRGRNERNESDRGLIDGFRVKYLFGWKDFWKEEIRR